MVQVGHMSAQTHEAGIPQWDLADRLAKALRTAGVGHGEMAEHLGVSRNTVGNYTAGRRTPNLATLRVWALRTGVPLEWLQTGQVTAASGQGGPEGESVQPTDWTDPQVRPTLRLVA